MYYLDNQLISTYKKQWNEKQKLPKRVKNENLVSLPYLLVDNDIFLTILLHILIYRDVTKDD